MVNEGQRDTQQGQTRKRRPRPKLVHVSRKEWLSPHMIRVFVTGPELTGWPSDKSGGNIKIAIPEPDWSADVFQSRLDAGPRPTIRTYTARFYDPVENELAIDFVVHDGHGAACNWAKTTEPGGLLGVAGPSGVKLTRLDADWYLICADMSAMPAAEAALESLPAHASGHIVFEVSSAADRRFIRKPDNMVLHWLVNDQAHRPSTQQIQLAKTLDWPDGQVAAFVAGESSVIKDFRNWLIVEGRVEKQDAYISGYWKIGLIEDEHQAEKRASN